MKKPPCIYAEWALLLGFCFIFAALLLAGPHLAQAQADGAETQKNAQQARAALDAMVQALGGQAWLDRKNETVEQRVTAYFHGQPSPGDEQLWEVHQWPDSDRIDVTKHRDVVEFFVGNQGWEVTYRGKIALPQDQVDDFLRRRAHSIETAVKVWMKNPQTLLIDEGQHMAERHRAEQLTLISPENESVTILIDAETHLPLQRIFAWRDPVYHDKNTDIEEYADYHTIGGFPTPLSITRYKNGDITRQYYVVQVSYNQALPADFWDVDSTAQRLKKK
jgi:hypothetical protein